jgi:ABC-type dipeptide/oligopeptide/nickel transport system permease subunit
MTYLIKQAREEKTKFNESWLIYIAVLILTCYVQCGVLTSMRLRDIVAPNSRAEVGNGN